MKSCLSSSLLTLTLVLLLSYTVVCAPHSNGALEPGKVRVQFETTKGNFIVAVHPDWAATGAKRFLDLVTAKFFDQAGIFRVVDGFVAQFGLSADPSQNSKWNVLQLCIFLANFVYTFKSYVYTQSYLYFVGN